MPKHFGKHGLSTPLPSDPSNMLEPSIYEMATLLPLVSIVGDLDSLCFPANESNNCSMHSHIFGQYVEAYQFMF